MSDNSERLAECRRLFNLKKKYAGKINEIESDWTQSFENIWIVDRNDLPDTIVDVVDYGQNEMSFKEFCARMDMEFKRQEGD